MKSTHFQEVFRRPGVRLSLVLLAALTVGAQPAAKRPLNHRDYDSWRAIASQTLSRDGKFLAYALFPQEGDGQLVVRNLATGKELRENAGTPPPPRETADPEGPPADQTPGAGLRISFTHDGRFVVASTFPIKTDTDKATAERKRPEEMPKAGMLIVDVAAMSASRVQDVATFQVPENGDGFVVYLKQPKPGQTPAAAPGNGDRDDFADQARGGRGGAAAGRGRAAGFGSDLVLRDLRAGGKEVTFEDVTEYTIAKDAKTLVYAVASKKDETNGIYAMAPGSEAESAALLKGKGLYTKFTWDFYQRQGAFMSDRGDSAAKPSKYKVYLWDRKSAAPVVAVDGATPGFQAGYAIAPQGILRFSRDGSRLFVSSAPAELIAAAEADPARERAHCRAIFGVDKSLRAEIREQLLRPLDIQGRIGPPGRAGH